MFDLVSKDNEIVLKICKTIFLNSIVNSTFQEGLLLRIIILIKHKKYRLKKTVCTLKINYSSGYFFTNVF
ncbi:hypothetical protein ASG01_09385 [Chryseobacterium sp. Leaf180]|nr:hypothetical protein ASG01_09385 [Chryseobacterium sp. Leaf180]